LFSYRLATVYPLNQPSVHEQQPISAFSWLNPCTWRYSSKRSREKNTDPLLTQIQIQGRIITLYARKTVGEELNGVFTRLGGRIIQADEIEHETAHGHRKEDQNFPHVHYIMPRKNVEQGIADLVKAIFKVNTPDARKKEYHDFLSELEMSRRKTGHEKFPKYVQDAIDQYDLDSPFLLTQNCDELIQEILYEYNKYRTIPNNERCRMLVQTYLVAIVTPFILAAEARGSIQPTPAERHSVQQFDKFTAPLMQIENSLKELQQASSNSNEVLHKIRDLISQVNVEELVKFESKDMDLTEGGPLSDQLKFISDFATSQLSMSQ